MADITDHATELEDLQRNYAISVALRKNVRQRSECCVECGVPIPEKRQEILGGTDVCVDCAE